MEKIFSTKERIRILNAVIFKEKPISVNAVAAGLKISKGLVSKYFGVLVKEGVAKRSGGKYKIIGSAITRGVRIFLSIGLIDTGTFKKYDFIRAAGLYGSCARGENTEESDVDLWIRVDEVDDGTIASLTAELQKKINKANLLFLTAKKIGKMQKSDPLFYHSLAFGSITLYGRKDGIQL